MGSYVFIAAFLVIHSFLFWHSKTELIKAMSGVIIHPATLPTPRWTYSRQQKTVPPLWPCHPSSNSWAWSPQLSSFLSSSLAEQLGFMVSAYISIFHLHGITEDSIIWWSQLIWWSTHLVMQLSPAADGKYAALKQDLLQRYSLSAVERACKLLSLLGFGNGLAVEFMDFMLLLLSWVKVVSFSRTFSSVSSAQLWRTLLAWLVVSMLLSFKHSSIHKVHWIPCS